MGDAVTPPGAPAEDDLERARVRAAVAGKLFGRSATPPRIGPYEIRRRLGAGAMGVVYEGWDPRLHRRVALKMLRESGGEDRLLREARALAQLRHPNVVAVYDVGSHEGRVYVAMEAVDGMRLGEWVRTAAPSIAERIAVLRQAGRGLAAAHARGLVHRDFKPDNVLVDSEGIARVVDFGLVQVGSDPFLTTLAAEQPGASWDVRLTRTGTVLGTPAYMPPEQLRGEETDARSDQYAFAATAYEVLYGVPSVEADSIGELVDRVLNGEPDAPPSVGEPALVRAAVLRGLARDPRARFESIETMLESFDGRGGDARSGAAASHVGAKSGSKLPLVLGVALAVVVLVLLSVGGGVLVWRTVRSAGDGAGAPVAGPVPMGPVETKQDAGPVVVATPKDAGTARAQAESPDAATDTVAVTMRTPMPRRDPPGARRDAGSAAASTGDDTPADPNRVRMLARRLLVASTENRYTSSVLERAAEPIQDMVARCFPPGYEPEHGTSTFFTVTVGANGEIENVHFDGRVLGPVSSCIRRAIHRLRLPPPTRPGEISFHVPLHAYGYREPRYIMVAR